MTATQHTLFYFTESYPYGLGESFVGPELNFLAEHFKVLVFPSNGSGAARALPSGVELQPVVQPGSTKLRQVKNWRRYGNLVDAESKEAENPEFVSSRKAEYRSMLAQASLRADRIQALAQQHRSVIYYTFWMNNWALTLQELKCRKVLSRYVVRVNGFDLYSDRRPGHYVPFRDYNVAGASHVLTTSAFAERYLRDSYPRSSTEFETNYLGTIDHGKGAERSGSSRFALHLLSVGWMRPVKRVDLLARAISQLNFPVQWTHVGDGPEMRAIAAIVSSYQMDHEVILKGNISNPELMRCYQEHYFDAVVHTSESEGGAPVALQEAISFGVPVVGTAVGGVPEVVTNSTGTLLEANPAPEAIAAALEELVESKWQTEATRSAIRTYWEDHFQATHHQRRLLEVLLLTGG